MPSISHHSSNHKPVFLLDFNSCKYPSLSLILNCHYLYPIIAISVKFRLWIKSPLESLPSWLTKSAFLLFDIYFVIPWLLPSSASWLTSSYSPSPLLERSLFFQYRRDCPIMKIISFRFLFEASIKFGILF